MQRDVEPKKLPRNVEMERRRRIYKNLKLKELLRERGICTHDILPPDVISPIMSDEEKYGLFSRTHYLPLEIFDDEDFDCK